MLEGSITLFLSLILLLILSIISTLVESTRLSAANTKCKQVTYLAVDSCFSSYAKEVFEDYGIMMLWKTDSDFLKDYNNYVVKNTNYCKGDLEDTQDLLGIRLDKSNIKEIVHATDQNGELIANQICDYMKYKVPSDTIEQLLSNSNLLSQSTSINGVFDKINSFASSFKNIEETVKSISDSINKINEIIENEKICLEKMKNELSLITNNIDLGTNIDEYFEEYKEIHGNLSSLEQESNNLLSDIINYSNKYTEYTLDAKEKLDELRNNIKMDTNFYDSEITSIVNKELNDINLEIVDQSNDFYNVIHNKQDTENQKVLIESINNELNMINAETNNIINNHIKLSEYTNKYNFITNLSNAINKKYDFINNSLSNLLHVNLNYKEQEKSDDGIINYVDNLKTNGTLGYIAKGKISDHGVDLTEKPSIVSNTGKGKWKDYGTVENNVRKVLVGQYVFDKFKCYVNATENNLLNYEVEYIINGENNDKNNLSDVCNKITLLREGFNLIYLLKDEVKRGEAYTMAAGIVGFTGMPAVIRITQYLILGAWAYAESIVDVRDLLDGKKVKLIKSSEDWNLSLSGIYKLESRNKTKPDSDGLSYQDYLRYFLYTQNKQTQIYRICDLIEMNINEKYNDQFRIQNCIVGINLSTDYNVKSLFTSFLFIRQLLKDKRDSYKLKSSQQYEY